MNARPLFAQISSAPIPASANLHAPVSRPVVSDCGDCGDDWPAFVRAYGWRAAWRDLAHLLGQPRQAIERVRAQGACVHHAQPKGFAELFALRHGRAPVEADWPRPEKGSAGHYAWLPPELALLAQLVGQVSVETIADMLTRQLRQLTGDETASRSRSAIQSRLQILGLQTTDVVGGITVAEAGREIGSLQAVYEAIESGKLRARNVGRLKVIPHDAWAEWKASHIAPAAGLVRLSALREPLGMRSDKLSEFARMGYVPTAVSCNPTGAGPSSRFGTWWIDPKVAEQLVADRRVGKPMPWHGRPMMDNLKRSYALWVERRHPASCPTCAQIWGDAGAPATFDDYLRRYPLLARGATRHLTRVFDSGLTLAEVAARSGRSLECVERAIDAGALQVTQTGPQRCVSKTDATRWVARKTPDGGGEKSWISLTTASRAYGFSIEALRSMIARGVLKHRIGKYGGARDVVYVPRQQCRDLREAIGMTRDEAARYVGVPIHELKRLLDGLHWRQAGLIPFVTVQSVIKRRESHHGWSLEEAAAELGVSLAWVEARRDDGTVRLTTAKWAPERPYLTAPMLQRLREALAHPKAVEDPADVRARSWPTAGQAALDAGVTTATLYAWAEAGDLERRLVSGIWRYAPNTVRARARAYWAMSRFKRARIPQWLQEERQATEWEAARCASPAPSQAGAERFDHKAPL